VADDGILDETIRTRRVRRQFDAIEQRFLAPEEFTPAPGVAPVPAAVLAVVHAAPLMAPTEVERPRGVVRHPSKFRDFDKATRAAILAAAAPMVGPVVLVIVHANCCVVGPFDSPEAARAWWHVEWNRLASSTPYALLPAPGVGAR
jgi:hypothetical protein